MTGKNARYKLLFLLFGIIVLICIPLIHAESETITQEEGSIVDLTIWKIIWNWINFGILLYLLHRFLTKPVLQFLDARKKEINKNLEQSEEARQEADNILNEYRDKMASARKEAMDIIDKARQRGAEKEKELYAEAKQQAQELIKEAKEDIRGEVEKARKQLVSEIGHISVKIASAMIEKELDEQLSEDFVREQIEKFGDSQ